MNTIAIIIALATSMSTQSKPNVSFEQLEEKIYNAYRSLKDYKETVEIRFESTEGNVDYMIKKLISKEKYYTAIYYSKDLITEGGYDGKNLWVISHLDNTYSSQEIENSYFKEKYTPKKHNPNEENSFSLVFHTSYDIRFLYNLPEKLQIKRHEQMELQNKKIDRFFITADTEASKIEITLDVDSKYYTIHGVLVKVNIKSDDKENDYIIKCKVIDVSHEAKLNDKDFILDLTKVRGYKKVDG